MSIDAKKKKPENGGSLAADVPTKSSGKAGDFADNANTSNVKLKAFARMLGAAFQNPFVTVNFAILIALATIAVVYNGKNVISTFANGEPIAIGMILAAQLVILGCSVAAATLATKAKIAALEEVARSDSRLIAVMAGQYQHLRSTIFEIGEQMRSQLSEGVVLLRDAAAFWRSVPAGGSVVAIQPGSRSEVSEINGAKGEVRHQVSRDGLLTVIKRFHPEVGVQSADVVFMQSKTKLRKNANTSEAQRFISLYEAADRVARSSGLRTGLNFDAIRIYFVAREEIETTSNFIIDAKLATNEARKLLVRYQSSTDPLAPVFGRTLEVVTEQAEIDAALINADRMIKSAARSMSYCSFKAQYLDLAPASDADLSPISDEERVELGLPFVEGTTLSPDDYYDGGDGSFRI